MAEPEPTPDSPPPAGESPRASVDFLLELVAVTAGVLLAMTLGGIREWQQDRALVREARQTISLEIAANRAELGEVLASAEERRRRLDQALTFADEMVTRGETEIDELDLGFSFAELSSASWMTAERTGALAHMDYPQVREYSRLYEVQTLFEEQQRRSLERLAAAMTLFRASDNPKAAAPSDLQLFRQDLRLMYAELEIEEQLARRLAELYDQILARDAGVADKEDSR